MLRVCSTCHWWFSPDVQSKMRLCVWHTGIKGSKAAKVDFGGHRSLTTTADFGCNDWKQDARHATLASLGYEDCEPKD